MSIPFLYEDHEILLVNKPFGLQVEPDNNGNPNLLEEVKTILQWPKRKEIYLVNRLDRSTSGIVVIAKKKSDLVLLQEQWIQKKVTKKYLAVVQGALQSKSGKLTHYLQKDSIQFKALVSKQRLNKYYKECVLNYQLIKNDGGYNLVEVELETGRYHQIRAQFGFIGHPLWNDFQYGAARICTEACIGLHAYSIHFFLPSKQKEIFYRSLPYHHPAFELFAHDLIQIEEIKQ